MTQKNISQDEVAVYDRQIRLWGLEAQQRIGNAHILIAGLRTISNEVAKNLVLAGIGSVTLLDHTIVGEQEANSHFFWNSNDIGKNKAEATLPPLQTLNPRVNIIVDQDNIKDKCDTYFESFDIVCLFHMDVQLLMRVNNIRRKRNKPFYTADAFGWIGYIFCDLVQHIFIEEKKKTQSSKAQEPTITRTTITETYNSLSDSLNKNWKGLSSRNLKKRMSPITFLIQILFNYQQKKGLDTDEIDIDELLKEKDTLLHDIGVNDSSVLSDDLLRGLSLYQTELVPISAIVGGVLAQEIIKVLSAKELPIQNWFYYNGYDGTGLIHQLK